MTVGVVTGLARESACLAAGVAVRCAGADARRAAAAAEDLVADGAGALLSFGLAGGLTPALAPGRLVIAEAVALPGGGRLACSARWRAAAWDRLAVLDPVSAVVAGVDRPVLSPEGKADLAAASGAAAVDTESHAVALAALRAGLPFLAVRAVADPAARTVPSFVLAAIAADGGVSPWPVLRGLVRRPWLLGEVLALAADSRAALSTLRRAAAMLGTDFVAAGPEGGG